MDIDKKICVVCKNEKSLPEFYKNLSYPDNYDTRCKICFAEYQKLHYNTLNGFLQLLITRAYQRSKQRTADGRIEAGKFAITLDYIINMWNDQSGLCYYSGLPMITKSGSDFQCSLERKNRDMGYIKSNVVLTCLELNGVMQWSHEKLMRLVYLMNQPKDMLAYKNHDFTYKKSYVKRQDIEKFIIDNIEHVKCNQCKLVKLRNEFNKQINYCKSCQKINIHNFISTPKGAIKSLLTSANTNTKTRNKNNELY